MQPHRQGLVVFGEEEVMIESARRHGTFDVRYPIRRKAAAPAWELQRDWDHRGRLDWSAFVAGSFPNGRRHDFQALAAYAAYGNALDRAASLRRSSTRRPARHTEIVRGGGSPPRARRAPAAAGAGLAVQTVSPSPALSVWESEGGSVGRGDFV
jgi:hypothetical protein